MYRRARRSGVLRTGLLATCVSGLVAAGCASSLVGGVVVGGPGVSPVDPLLGPSSDITSRAAKTPGGPNLMLPIPTITPPPDGPEDVGSVSGVLMKQYAMTPKAVWGLTCGPRFDYFVSGAVSERGFIIDNSADLVGLDNGINVAIAAPSGIGPLIIVEMNCSRVDLADEAGRAVTYDLTTHSWQ